MISEKPRRATFEAPIAARRASPRRPSREPQVLLIASVNVANLLLAPDARKGARPDHGTGAFGSEQREVHR